MLRAPLLGNGCLQIRLRPVVSLALQSFRLDPPAGRSSRTPVWHDSGPARKRFRFLRVKPGVLSPFKLPERTFRRHPASQFACSKLWAYTDLYHNVSVMAKFIFSMGNENYRKLQLEAKTRDVTIQALIRTVVIPEWIRTHIDTTATNTHANLTETSSLLSHTTGFIGQSHRSLPPSVGRSRT